MKNLLKINHYDITSIIGFYFKLEKKECPTRDRRKSKHQLDHMPVA